jgi:DNA polymerase I-like protein with 3'-5' exonuclease and polymerase domains
MFQASPGFSFVGCDASGLELRVFAGYLAHFDDGAYASVVTEGDVHTSNQEAAGLATRDDAKTFVYSFLFGAGDGKLGSIAGGGKPQGAKLRQAFLDKTTGLESLVELVKRKASTQGFILGLDRRHMYPRSAHSALNLLIQGAGAIIMKEALIQMYYLCLDKGLLLGRDYYFVLNVHDEFQAEVTQEATETYASLAPLSIKKAGEVLGLLCPLDGEAKVGLSWADTH